MGEKDNEIKQIELEDLNEVLDGAIKEFNQNTYVLAKKPTLGGKPKMISKLMKDKNFTKKAVGYVLAAAIEVDRDVFILTRSSLTQILGRKQLLNSTELGQFNAAFSKVSNKLRNSDKMQRKGSVFQLTISLGITPSNPSGILDFYDSKGSQNPHVQPPCSTPICTPHVSVSVNKNVNANVNEYLHTSVNEEEEKEPVVEYAKAPSPPSIQNRGTAAFTPGGYPSVYDCNGTEELSNGYNVSLTAGLLRKGAIPIYEVDQSLVASMAEGLFEIINPKIAIFTPKPLVSLDLIKNTKLAEFIQSRKIPPVQNFSLLTWIAEKASESGNLSNNTNGLSVQWHIPSNATPAFAADLAFVKSFEAIYARFCCGFNYLSLPEGLNLPLDFKDKFPETLEIINKSEDLAAWGDYDNPAIPELIQDLTTKVVQNEWHEAATKLYAKSLIQGLRPPTAIALNEAQGPAIRFGRVGG